MLDTPRFHIRTHIARKLLLAVGLPSFAAALLGVLWLGSSTHARGLWRPFLGFLVVLAAAMATAHLVAVRILLERPLSRMVAALKRAEEEDFLLRVPVESDDELSELARSFNTALAAITDLNARRIEDAQSMESMQRELALKVEVEAQHALLDEANHRLKARLRELTLISDLGRAFNSTLKLDEVLHVLTDLVGRTLGYSSFWVFLLCERSGELVVRSIYGIEPGAEGWRVPLGEGIAGLAVREHRRILVRDTKADGRFQAEHFTYGEEGSLLAVPMIFQGTCVGALDFFRPTIDAFGDDEIAFLDSVASQAAMAVSNAHLHEKTVELSLTDPLTGLHNRRSLFEKLEMELERSARFSHHCALALIDVDHFEHLNHTLGRRASDAALRRLSELLLGAVRRIDTLARYWGEEFALILPQTDRAGALETAEKLRELVASAPFEHPEASPPFQVTVSIGISLLPEHGNNPTALIDCADAALFSAKRNGRNQVVAYAPGMREGPARPRDHRIAREVEPADS
ncbi:MAG TPA: diguanylate cyclase [Anaeromyxobacteraceae bacterium]|nr:diguanylate cyclase [Anaeromyxobacteraceae bacterium]